MSTFYTHIWFRIGVFVFILLVVILKFWLARRKYLKEKAEREAIAESRLRNSTAARNSFLLIEEELRERDLIQHQIRCSNFLEVPPPPDFEDAIKYSKKFDRDEAPPSYNEYIRTISSESYTEIEIPSVHKQKDFTNIELNEPTDTASSRNEPSVENYL